MASYPTRPGPATGGTRPIGSPNRGFASVDPERQREVANPGGKAANENSNANAASTGNDGSRGSAHGSDSGSETGNGNGKFSGSR